MIKYKKIEHNISSLFPKLKKQLALDKDVIFAYIFGSYGIGKPNPLSDIDIAIYIANAKDTFKKKMKLIGKIISTLKTEEFDLVILNDAPMSLQFQVLKTGRLLFSKNDKVRINFAAKTYSLSCDYEPLKQIAIKRLIQRSRDRKIGT